MNIKPITLDLHNAFYLRSNSTITQIRYGSDKNARVGDKTQSAVERSWSNFFQFCEHFQQQYHYCSNPYSTNYCIDYVRHWGSLKAGVAALENFCFENLFISELLKYTVYSWCQEAYTCTTLFGVVIVQSTIGVQHKKFFKVSTIRRSTQVSIIGGLYSRQRGRG